MKRPRSFPILWFSIMITIGTWSLAGHPSEYDVSDKLIASFKPNDGHQSESGISCCNSYEVRQPFAGHSACRKTETIEIMKGFFLDEVQPPLIPQWLINGRIIIPSAVRQIIGII